MNPYLGRFEMVCMCFLSLWSQIGLKKFIFADCESRLHLQTICLCVCVEPVSASAPLDAVLLNEPIIQVGHPARMKETGITGQKGRTPGVVPVRNNHWMQLAAQSQLGPDSSGQRPRRNVSESALKYSCRMAHCEKCHTTSGAPEREGSEDGSLEDTGWWRCWGGGQHSNEWQLQIHRERSLYLEAAWSRGTKFTLWKGFTTHDWNNTLRHVNKTIESNLLHFQQTQAGDLLVAKSVTNKYTLFTLQDNANECSLFSA